METNTNLTHECAELQLGTILLSPTEVADRLSFSRSRVYTLMEAGSLRTVRIGRSRRIPLRAIYEFIAALDQQDPAIAHPRDTIHHE